MHFMKGHDPKNLRTSQILYQIFGKFWFNVVPTSKMLVQQSTVNAENSRAFTFNLVQHVRDYNSRHN